MKKKQLVLALVAAGSLAAGNAAAGCSDSAIIAEVGRLAKEHLMDTYATTFSGYKGMTYEDLKYRVKNGTQFLADALRKVEAVGSQVTVDVSAARQVGESKEQVMCRAQFAVNRPDGTTRVSLQYAVFHSGGKQFVELYFN